MIATTDTNTLFETENERRNNGYKTGFFTCFTNDHQLALAVEHDCECLGAGHVEIDWFTTRTKKQEPVIRVKWHFPSRACRKVYSGGYVSRKMTWDCTTKEQRFPFTVEGLEAALDFANKL